MSHTINDGFMILDKPPRMICHEVTSWVKKIVGAKKAGHAGTLDPDVTGVLPIGFGPSTKLLPFIAGKRKIYVGIAYFKKEKTEREIKEIFSKFIGEIEQTPPKESAVAKIKRKRHVYELKLLEVKGSRALFYADVEAGTYIRVLCRDMGAEMAELRRTRVGNIEESESVKIQDVIDAMWLWREKNDDSLIKKIIIPPGEMMARVMKKMLIKEGAAKALLSGAQLMAPGVEEISDRFEKGENIALFSDGKFVGVAKALFSSEEIKNMKRGQVAKTLRVHPSLF
ncbi:MAG: RNA-guided pseudouridylation complex pseudouridine synthase subunit Cbf5 [Candidatus Anstonellales archaeon]